MSQKLSASSNGEADALSQEMNKDKLAKDILKEVDSKDDNDV